MPLVFPSEAEGPGGPAPPMVTPTENRTGKMTAQPVEQESNVQL